MFVCFCFYKSFRGSETCLTIKVVYCYLKLLEDYTIFIHSFIFSLTLKSVNEMSEGIAYYSLVFYSGVCMGVSVGLGAAVVAVYSACDVVDVNGRC